MLKCLFFVTYTFSSPYFKIGGAEDNFIFYIEYCLFFVSMIKLRWEYNILEQFQSIPCLMFDYGHIFPKKLCDLVKNQHFWQKKTDSTLFHAFSASQPSWSAKNEQNSTLHLRRNRNTKTCPKFVVLGNILIFSVFEVHFFETF